jgi:hypothetical protein
LQLEFPDLPGLFYTIRYRNVLEAIQSLWGDPALAAHLIYRPTKIFSDENKKTRIFTELWTGQWWHIIQVNPYNNILLYVFNNHSQSKLPKDATCAPIIIATDKTQLTQFVGGKSAYPVYLTLGNIPKSL